mgnify:CR=1 FL=1
MSSNLNSATTTYTVSQFISLKNSDSITYKNYSILQQSLKDSSIYYSIDNVIYEYMDELAEANHLSLKDRNNLQEGDYLVVSYYGDDSVY